MEISANYSNFLAKKIIKLFLQITITFPELKPFLVFRIPMKMYLDGSNLKPKCLGQSLSSEYRPFPPHHPLDTSL